MFEGVRLWFEERAREKEVLWGYSMDANELRDQINNAATQDRNLKVKYWKCKATGPEGQHITGRIAEGTDLNELVSTYVDEDYSVKLLCQVNFSTLIRFGQIIYESDGAVKYKAQWASKDESEALKTELQLSKAKLEDAILIS